MVVDGTFVPMPATVWPWGRPYQEIVTYIHQCWIRAGYQSTLFEVRRWMTDMNMPVPPPSFINQWGRGVAPWDMLRHAWVATRPQIQVPHPVQNNGLNPLIEPSAHRRAVRQMESNVVWTHALPRILANQDYWYIKRRWKGPVERQSAAAQYVQTPHTATAPGPSSMERD